MRAVFKPGAIGLRGGGAENGILPAEPRRPEAEGGRLVTRLAGRSMLSPARAAGRRLAGLSIDSPARAACIGDIVWLAVRDRTVLTGEDGAGVAVSDGGVRTGVGPTVFAVVAECRDVREEPEWVRSRFGREFEAAGMLGLLSMELRYREML